jgi:hypothetical protein
MPNSSGFKSWDRQLGSQLKNSQKKSAKKLHPQLICKVRIDGEFEVACV